MSYHPEDPCPDSDTDATTVDGHMSSPTVVHHTTIIKVSPGSSVNLQVGDNNLQQHHLSKSSENLLTPCCETCGSLNTSPTATISRSFSTEFLDSVRKQFTPSLDFSGELHGKVDSLIRKFDNSTANSAASSPIVIKKRSTNHQTSNESETSENSFSNEPSFVNSIPDDIGPEMDNWEGQDLFKDSVGQYSWRESDTSSCSGSDFTAESSDNTSFTNEAPALLPRRNKICQRKAKVKTADDDDDEYMSMDGSCAGSLKDFRTQPIPIQSKTRDQKGKTSGKIPKHKIEEAQATLGFRSDVNGELKRVCITYPIYTIL